MFSRGSFPVNQASLPLDLRQLLKKDSVWVWSYEHNDAVQQLKQILSSHAVLKFFDLSKAVKLQVDASVWSRSMSVAGGTPCC